MRNLILGALLGAAAATAINAHAQEVNRTKRANAREALRTIAANVKQAGSSTAAQRERALWLLAYIELTDDVVEPAP